MNDDLIRKLRPDQRTKGQTAQLAAQLAPLEELDKKAALEQLNPQSVNGGATHEVGAIIIEDTPAELADHLTDVRRGKTFVGMEPVTLVILVGMLLFIAFIAWQITLMPREGGG